MALKIDLHLTAERLVPKVQRLFELSAGKILSVEKSWRRSKGTPVFTISGKYTSRGWTEWTQGFQYGSAILQYDATGERRFLELGRANTVRYMASHVSHMGVHDHGFNNISTYGNLWRLMREGRIPTNDREMDFYELALKVSGAVQASRWTKTADGKGFIYSFNGPHSLFVDSLRSLRSLAVAHQLGHSLMAEHDRKVSLLQRLVEHAQTTAQFNIYYGEGRDAYDVNGRTAHEAIFNTNDGTFRCPNSQQGYSPFSTWTRGLSWALLGFAEQLEFLQGMDGSEMTPPGTDEDLLKAAVATAEFYLSNSCADGVPMWDTGAPHLCQLQDYLSKPADPFNGLEPVDSSAASIAAQGLLRLGNYLCGQRQRARGDLYRRAAFTIVGTLCQEPYVSRDPKHQGLLLHSVYHRPNGWDYVSPGQKIPNGESSMWGDYHLRELGVLILREARNDPYLTFFAKRNKRFGAG